MAINFDFDFAFAFAFAFDFDFASASASAFDFGSASSSSFAFALAFLGVCYQYHHFWWRLAFNQLNRPQQEKPPKLMVMDGWMDVNEYILSG